MKTFLKWALYIFIGLVVLAVLLDDGSSTATPTSPGQQTSDSQQQETVYVGETVETPYFAYTVTATDTARYIGGEYTREEAGAGSMFVRIQLQAENIDTEARSFSSGTLYGFLNGKTYTFDTSEVVFEDGYHSFDSINPLVTSTGIVVFKVSDKFVLSEMMYQPPRSDVFIKLTTRESVQTQ